MSTFLVESYLRYVTMKQILTRSRLESQLYKEHVLLKHKQPVQMEYINFILSTFQFIIAAVLSPLVLQLQGLGATGDWTSLYPPSSISQNFADGFQCFVYGLSEYESENKYPEVANCDYTTSLTVGHVLSLVFIGVAVDKIVNAGATKIMYRGVSAGIIVSVIVMHLYDLRVPDFNYGPAIDALNLFCLILLILGSEVYHRVALSESTFQTDYPAVHNVYDDANGDS